MIGTRRELDWNLAVRPQRLTCLFRQIMIVGKVGCGALFGVCFVWCVCLAAVASNL